MNNFGGYGAGLVNNDVMFRNGGNDDPRFRQPQQAFQQTMQGPSITNPTTQSKFQPNFPNELNQAGNSFQLQPSDMFPQNFPTWEMENMNQMSQLDQMAQVNQLKQMNQMHQMNQGNQMNQLNQLNHMNQVNQMSQVNQMNFPVGNDAFVMNNFDMYQGNPYQGIPQNMFNIVDQPYQNVDQSMQFDQYCQNQGVKRPMNFERNQGYKRPKPIDKGEPQQAKQKTPAAPALQGPEASAQAAKTARSKGLWCETCQIGCTDETSFAQHKIGRNHAKKLNALQVKKNELLQTIEDVPATSESEGPSGASTGASAPSITRAEGSAAPAASQRPLDTKADLWCELCQISTTDAVSLKMHMIGAKHRKKANQIAGGTLTGTMPSVEKPKQSAEVASPADVVAADQPDDGGRTPLTLQACGDRGFDRHGRKKYNSFCRRRGVEPTLHCSQYGMAHCPTFIIRAPLPLPEHPGACGVGSATKKVDAELLACMDANQILEDLKINVHERVASAPPRSSGEAGGVVGLVGWDGETWTPESAQAVLLFLFDQGRDKECTDTGPKVHTSSEGPSHAPMFTAVASIDIEALAKRPGWAVESESGLPLPVEGGRIQGPPAKAPQKLTAVGAAQVALCQKLQEARPKAMSAVKKFLAEFEAETVLQLPLPGQVRRDLSDAVLACREARSAAFTAPWPNTPQDWVPLAGSACPWEFPNWNPALMIDRQNIPIWPQAWPALPNAPPPSAGMPSQGGHVPPPPPSPPVWSPDKAAAKRRSQEMLKKHKASQGGPLAAERAALPAAQARNTLLQALKHNQVVVVSGPTGCGKSTQVPQYILEDMVSQGKGGECSVLITQPRRLAAVSLAARVARERGEELGDSVGYHIRLDRRTPRTQGGMCFATQGLLTRRFQVDPLLVGVSHLILDEVHERGLQLDLALTLLKEQVLPKRPDLKVIIMSATIHPVMFAEYFNGAPHVQMEAQCHPVSVHFLEDLPALSPDLRLPDSAQTKSRDDLEGNEECERGEVPFDLVEKLLVHLVRTQAQTQGAAGGAEGEGGGAVLVILPGWADITKVSRLVGINSELYDVFYIVRLHSSVSMEEQQAAVMPATQVGPMGVLRRKLVLATNIAEASLTIQDVTAVIDTGLVKEKAWHPGHAASSLLTTWISQSSALQRRGRAGRTQPGACFHLFTRTKFQALTQFPASEMSRLPLTSLCLQVKTLVPKECVSSFLALVVEPPCPERVQEALRRLHAMGCTAHPTGGDLTPLGKTLAVFPTEPAMGKMLILAAMLGCVEPVLTLAALDSVKELFSTSFEKQRLLGNSKRSFSNWSRSDHIANINAYDRWREAVESGIPGAEDNLLESQYLDKRTLTQAHGIRQQLRELLDQAGIIAQAPVVAGGYWSAPSGPEADLSSPGEREALLKAVLCSGLHPGYAQHWGGSKSSLFRTAPCPAAGDARGVAMLHPTSVNYRDRERPHPYLVFQEQIVPSRLGGKVYLRGTTCVPPWALLLFGSPELKGHQDVGAISMDGWATFKVRGDVDSVLKLIQEVHKEVNDMLDLCLSTCGNNEMRDRLNPVFKRFVQLTSTLMSLKGPAQPSVVVQNE